MKPRPVIGVPTQTLQAIDGIPEGLPHSWVMNHRYFTALTSVGAVPWMVPLLDDDVATLRAIYDHLDGLFLAGGVDVDPVSYQQDRHDLCGSTDVPRDIVELQLTRWARADGKPILGVCRGLQIINIAAGGTLHQDCAALVTGAIKHDYYPTQGYARDLLSHTVRLEPSSRLSGIFGAVEILVNSMHHQGIQTLGEDLRVTAVASDGLIEAIESERDAFVVGVQWHPEMLIDTDPGTRRLFESFVAAALEFRSATALLR